MMVPEMTKKGFSLEFSSVVTAASSMITPLIPPGIAMILYGCIANVSIGKLFVSGLGVGALLCITMMILVGVISKNVIMEIFQLKNDRSSFLESI